MGDLASRVLRLRTELAAARDGKRLSTEAVRQLRQRIGECMLRALVDEGHPLSSQLVELHDFVERERRALQDLSERPSGGDTAETAQEHAARRPIVDLSWHPSRPLFMPQPGTGVGPARAFWRLQLLLYVTATTPETATRLAERLELTPPAMAAAVREAERCGVAGWGEPQFIQLLHEALPALDYPDPPLPLRLVGDVVHLLDGRTVSLSRQEAIFLRTLIQRVDSEVEHDELLRAGVPNPAQTKNRLVKKLRVERVELAIHSPRGAYRLASSPA